MVSNTVYEELIKKRKKAKVRGKVSKIVKLYSVNLRSRFWKRN